MGLFASPTTPGKEWKRSSAGPSGTHLEVLGNEGLVTSRAPYVMRSQDGTYLEVFEWKSAEAITAAHHNPAVAALWARFERACEYRRLCDLAKSREMLRGLRGGGVGGQPRGKSSKTDCEFRLDLSKFQALPCNLEHTPSTTSASGAHNVLLSVLALGSALRLSM